MRFVRLNFVNGNVVSRRKVTYNTSIIRCFAELSLEEKKYHPAANASIEFVDMVDKHYVSQTYDELEELICLGDVIESGV